MTVTIATKSYMTVSSNGSIITITNTKTGVSTTSSFSLAPDALPIISNPNPVSGIISSNAIIYIPSQVFASLGLPSYYVLILYDPDNWPCAVLLDTTQNNAPAIAAYEPTAYTTISGSASYIDALIISIPLTSTISLTSFYLINYTASTTITMSYITSTGTVVNYVDATQKSSPQKVTTITPMVSYTFPDDIGEIVSVTVSSPSSFTAVVNGANPGPVFLVPIPPPPITTSSTSTVSKLIPSNYNLTPNTNFALISTYQSDKSLITISIIDLNTSILNTLLINSSSGSIISTSSSSTSLTMSNSIITPLQQYNFTDPVGGTVIVSINSSYQLCSASEGIIVDTLDIVTTVTTSLANTNQYTVFEPYNNPKNILYTFTVRSISKSSTISFTLPGNTTAIPSSYTFTDPFLNNKTITGILKSSQSGLIFLKIEALIFNSITMIILLNTISGQIVYASTGCIEYVPEKATSIINSTLTNQNAEYTIQSLDPATIVPVKLLNQGLSNSAYLADSQYATNNSVNKALSNVSNKYEKFYKLSGDIPLIIIPIPDTKDFTINRVIQTLDQTGNITSISPGACLFYMKN